MDKGRVSLMVMGAAACLAVIFASLYIGERLEQIEDRLQYRPPAAQQPGSEAVTLDEGMPRRAVYVPAYSHVYSNGGQAYLVETTLSIRNTDPQQAIVISAVRYFDTQGKLVKDHLAQALRLGPLESTEFLVEKRDVSGGSGANFVVEWSAEGAVNPPIIEAVMIGFAGSNSISLIRSGHPIDAE